MGYATMSTEPCCSAPEACYEPIPAIVGKANESLCEALSMMCRLYKALFGNEPKMSEVQKCECLEQCAMAVADRADEIRRATQALAERLGA